MVTENINKIIEHKRKEVLLNKILKTEFKGKFISKVVYFNTPLVEKVIIYCAKPRLVLGKANENLEKIIKICKRLGFKNPQIEAIPVENPLLDSEIVADLIASRIEKFGTKAARKIAIKVAEDVINAGAIGVEIRLTGKIIGERSSTVRIFKGNMKKSGEINKIMGVSIAHAKLPQGVIGIKVRILHPKIRIPDNIKIKDYKEIDIDKLESIDPNLVNILNEKIKESTHQQ
ncbi:MAG: hypothetical protein QXI77_01835 [Nanopusillaceae archaeon]